MAAIPVRVEPPGENPVVEVSYDGQEVLKKELSGRRAFRIKC